MSLRNCDGVFFKPQEQTILSARANGIAVPEDGDWVVLTTWGEFYATRRRLRKLSKVQLFFMCREVKEKCDVFKTKESGELTGEDYNNLVYWIVARGVLNDEKVVLLTPQAVPDVFQPLSTEEQQRLRGNSGASGGSRRAGRRKKKRAAKAAAKIKVVANPFHSAAPERGIESTWSKVAARKAVHGNVVVV
jgi:hypothetical protein